MENPIKMDDVGYPYFGNTQVEPCLLNIVNHSGVNKGESPSPPKKCPGTHLNSTGIHH